MPARFLLILFSGLASLLVAQQNNASLNISLLAKMAPNTSDQGIDGRKYSGCWGWYQVAKNKEYAIAGASNGTYFYDVTTPSAPVLSDFVDGPKGCTYREMKTRGHYCYIITDDFNSTGLQIVDLQYLPDSVSLVYEGKDYFKRAHSIWIDGAHMYLGSVTYSSTYVAMAVFSIANPTVPLHLRDLNDDNSFINTVHDLHTRHDTIYANSAYQGLHIFYFDSVQNKFSQLGSYTGFARAGYNHSSYLTDDGKHLVFCEEIPAGLPIRIVNVQNPANVQAESTVIPHPQTTPHNPFVKGNFAVVGCYEDGLYVYDISDPGNPSRAGFYDTYHQGGFEGGGYGTSNYRGTWGAYPYLPSGIIIANDMQNGIFLLDATAAYTTTVKDYNGITAHNTTSENLRAYYDQLQRSMHLLNQGETTASVTISDLCGKQILSAELLPQSSQIVNLAAPAGIYLVQFRSGHEITHFKITVH